MVRQPKGPTRDEKLENLIMNHSMIFMGMFEEAFSTLAEKMTEALAVGAGAVADALAGVSSTGAKRPSAGISKKFQGEITPEVRSQIGEVFSGIREEMASQWPKNTSVFKKYITSPAFDKGIKIVGAYDFGRPRITEKLSDEVLASYVFLVQSGDPEVAKMFKELSEWQSTLPKPPWADR
jgi:hypothetical protein